MTTAIITDDFRKNNLDVFFSDVFNSPGAGGKNYYIGIGKIDPWEPDAALNSELNTSFDPPVPTGSILEKRDVRENLMTLKKIKPTDIHRVIPQVKYRTGIKYKRYDITDPSCFEVDDTNDLFPCYAIYTDNDGNTKLYICLDNNNFGQTSNNIPTMGTTQGATNFPYGVEANASGDGYVWAYMDFYNKSSLTNLFGDSTTFINLTEDSDVDTVMNNITGHSAGYANGRDRATQTSAGLLYGFKIVNSGSGYPGGTTADNPPRTVANGNALDAVITGIRLDGTTIDDTASTAQVKVETNANGQVINVIWTLTQALALGFGRAGGINSAGVATTGLTATNGGGILEASLQITDAAVSTTAAGFIEAEIQPLIAPEYGFGHSPVSDMPSYYAGISADFKGTVGDNALASVNNTPPQYIGEALSDIYIRQVSLIRDTDGNISHGEDDSPYPDPSLAAEDALNCLQYFQLGGTDTGDFQNAPIGCTIHQIDNAVGSQPAIAWFDKASSYETLDPTDGDPNTAGNQPGGFRVYFHQNSSKEVNKKPFPTNGRFKVVGPTGNTLSGLEDVTYTDLRQGEYRQDTGEVLFLDNRKPILRNEQQTEEVRLIIQF